MRFESLAAWRNHDAVKGRKLVVTNGCFDLLHVGHVTYLEEAKRLGDVLLVGINGDEAVTALKGKGRPINNASDRSLVIAALQSVDAVCIFSDATATRFLTTARPDVYVKGGDYQLETLNQEERRAVENAGGSIIILPLTRGKSTSALVQKLGGQQS